MKAPVYTMTGDQGTTSLASGTRVLKCDVRIEAYGSVDELNSQIGVLAVETCQAYPEIYGLLIKTQNKLFNIGAYLANETAAGVNGVGDEDIKAIEEMIDKMYEKLPRAFRFVLPGGSRYSALADVCRTTARRAERRIIALAQEAAVDAVVLRYVNRLSDFFFVLSRYNNVVTGTDEVFWEK